MAKNVKLKIIGLICDSCMISVKNALSKLSGLKNVKVEKNSASFQARDDIEKSKVIEAVAETGYSAEWI